MGMEVIPIAIHSAFLEIKKNNQMLDKDLEKTLMKQKNAYLGVFLHSYAVFCNSKSLINESRN